jgi:hypothetical protein
MFWPAIIISQKHARKGSGIRHLAERLVLFAAIFFAGLLAAGCGQSGRGASASLAPSRSASLAPSRSASLAPSRSASLAPSGSAPATATVQPSATPGAATPVPTSQGGATLAPSASPAPSSGSNSGNIWLLVIIGGVVIIGVLVWVFRSAGGRSAAAAAWRSTVIDAYAKGAALYDAMSVAETPAAMAAKDAGPRWFDVQRRADDLAQMLYALREAAPDETSRVRVTDALASLQAARSAMDAERAPGGADARQAEVVRSRLFNFEATLRALRASDQIVA